MAFIKYLLKKTDEEVIGSWGIFHYIPLPNNGTPLALTKHVRLQRVFFPRMRKPAPIQRNKPSAAAKQSALYIPFKIEIVLSIFNSLATFKLCISTLLIAVL